jgi:hypothetical protein
MSDWSQEEGWWLASDGNWYPPTARPHRPLWRRPLVVAAALVVVASVAGGAYLLVPRSDESGATAEQGAGNGEPLAPTSAAATARSSEGQEGEIALTDRSYERGDCVTWSVDGVRPLRTPVVLDCAEPHRFEVSGSIEMPDGEYPTADEWDDVLVSHCRELNESLYGGPIDPAGDVQPTSMQPQPEGWAMGDRTVYCGLSRLVPDWTTEVLVTGLLRHPG